MNKVLSIHTRHVSSMRSVSLFFKRASGLSCVISSMTMLVSVGCVPESTRQSQEVLPTYFAVDDGAHGPATNPDFFFLPPGGLSPSVTPQNWSPGSFNGDLFPTVEICAVEGSQEQDADLLSGCNESVYFQSLQLTTADVNLADENYRLSWSIPDSSIAFYRISVKVGAKALGFAHVRGQASSHQGNNGPAVPITFRIERYALCSVPGVGPCSSKTVDLRDGGDVVTTLPGTEGVSGVDFSPRGGDSDPVTITLQPCPTLNGRAIDLPVFGPCLRVLADPRPEFPPGSRMTVFICDLGQFVAGMDHDQVHRITLHTLNESSGAKVVIALPHATACAVPTGVVDGSVKGLLRNLADGHIGNAGRQLAVMLAPKPLHAAVRLHLGAGGQCLACYPRCCIHDENSGSSLRRASAHPDFPQGSVPSLRASHIHRSAGIGDFQFALPVKMVKLAGDNQLAPPGGELPVAPTVLVRDLGDQPVAGVRVRFDPGTGCALGTGIELLTGTDGLARIPWKLGSERGTHRRTVCGRGVATTDVNGPRGGMAILDPFQPIQEPFDLTDGSKEAEAVLVGAGSEIFTATGVLQGSLVSDSVRQPKSKQTVRMAPRRPSVPR
jgi:hypothetical protein